MRAYFFKTSRDVASGHIHVQEVTQTSSIVKSFKVRRPGVVETMQVFTRKADAEAACLLEKEAAELSKRDFAEVQREAQELLAKFKREWRVPVQGVAAMLGIPASTLRTYYEGRAMNPRVLLRVKKLHEYIADACRRAAAVLPDDASTGNGLKGRGGNPNIWRSAPNRRITKTR